MNDPEVKRPPRTAMEVFRLLPEGTLCEVIENQLFMEPSPNDFHQGVSIDLATEMNVFVRKNQLGILRIAPYDVFLDEKNAFQPDILFISNENLKNNTLNGFYGAPDLVIEILSPSNEKHDLKDKKKIYERNGVKEYWIINPESKNAKGFELANGIFQEFSNASGAINSKLLNYQFSF
jgi:Uma2 family endonuclease